MAELCIPAEPWNYGPNGLRLGAHVLADYLVSFAGPHSFLAFRQFHALHDITVPEDVTSISDYVQWITGVRTTTPAVMVRLLMSPSSFHGGGRRYVRNRPLAELAIAYIANNYL